MFQARPSALSLSIRELYSRSVHSLDSRVRPEPQVGGFAFALLSQIATRATSFHSVRFNRLASLSAKKQQTPNRDGIKAIRAFEPTTRVGDLGPPRGAHERRKRGEERSKLIVDISAT
jgi:hypothetical protein